MGNVVLQRSCSDDGYAQRKMICGYMPHGVICDADGNRYMMQPISLIRHVIFIISHLNNQAHGSASMVSLSHKFQWVVLCCDVCASTPLQR